MTEADIGMTEHRSKNTLGRSVPIKTKKEVEEDGTSEDGSPRPMFSNSTQLKFWTFSGTTELNRLRSECNQQFIKKHGSEMSEEEKTSFFLTSAEETKICRHYQYALYEFCSKFKPHMPKTIMGTSMVFFKRFYLHNSVMDYHPRDIVYTCVYLACKVEEFYVNIKEFVGNLSSYRGRMMDCILSHELLLMQQLHYHLTVHSPYRPLEGLLIDIKTRCNEIGEGEKLRAAAEEFLDRAIHTSAALIFAPSQVALAALLHSSNKNMVSLDSYIANKLLSSRGKDTLVQTIEHVKRIRFMVKSLEPLNSEEIGPLKEKLEKCRNQDNNPDSEIYKRKIEEQLEDDEERRVAKRQKVAEEEKIAQSNLLGI